jgi:hypothetical protein
MPLVKLTLEAAIKAAFVKQAAKQKEGDDPKASIDELAADIATAVDTYIKSALVTVTGTSPAGPVTGTGIIS